MSDRLPVVRNIRELSAHFISPGDTVRLVELAGPDQGSSTSVFLEIWEPGGAQPVNSHADSAEIFIVLKGEALAQSDAHQLTLGPGDVLTLQPGSKHRIVNISPTDRLYTITVMANDGGFAHLVTGGVPVALEMADIATLIAANGA